MNFNEVANYEYVIWMGDKKIIMSIIHFNLWGRFFIDEVFDDVQIFTIEKHRKAVKHSEHG